MHGLELFRRSFKTGFFKHAPEMNLKNFLLEYGVLKKLTGRKAVLKRHSHLIWVNEKVRQFGGPFLLIPHKAETIETKRLWALRLAFFYYQTAR